MRERVQLILLEEADAEFELGVVGALLASRSPAGAVVVASLAGEVAALGRFQPRRRTGHAREARRLTGGRSTFYGDGILTLSAVVSPSQPWLDEGEELSGPRLLNRYVRGLLTGLGNWGLSAAYPGRDFVTVGGRRLAYVTLERTDSGVLLFQAVLGSGRTYLAGDPDPRFPGLPPVPEATWIERERGKRGALRELAAGYAARFSLDLGEVPAPPPTAPLPLDLGLPPHASGAVPIPIGELEAHLELAADGTLARLRFAGDWIASSAEVAMLEQALVGKPPESRLLRDVIDRWLGLPGNLTIGVVSSQPLVDAISSAAERARVAGSRSG